MIERIMHHRGLDLGEMLTVTLRMSLEKRRLAGNFDGES
jgi:hypothetical protein